MLKLENTSTASHHHHAAAHMAARTWLCESCHRAPAAFLCKADAASLCAACDSAIHSANPLARRHHRVPIMPVSDMLYGPSDSGLMMDQSEGVQDEAASWLLLNPVKNGAVFGGELDEYLDLDDYNSSQNSRFDDEYSNKQQDYGVLRKSYASDSVVPIQYGKGKENEGPERYYPLGLDYDSSNTGYNYPASTSHSVSLSSMDVGVVPESTSEVSISHQRGPKGTIELFSGAATEMPTQLTPMDREARVLRYREKKKNRKFEKTIRYASRKAYAETRPRIKGRFAKRTTDVEVKVEVDQMLSSSLMAQNACGIVPSFL